MLKMTDSNIKVRINGEPKLVASSSTLTELLRGFQMNPKTVVVELNRKVIAREKLSETPLGQGDEVEIVHFVGGGAAKPTGPKNLVIVE